MTITATLETYLTTAGQAVTPAITQILAGQPDNLSLPTLAYWYIGTRTWDAHTLTFTQEQEGWRIRLYLPLGPNYKPIAGNAEQYVKDVSDAIRGQLYGHVSVGGAATGRGIDIETTADPAYIQTVGGTFCRIVDNDWWVDLSNVHAIAD